VLLVPEPRIRLKPEEDGASADGEAGGLWSGVRCLTRHPLLRPLTISNAGVELAMQALFLALPILVFTEYDRRAALAGALVAAWGAGALAGTVLALRLAVRPPLPLVRAGMLAQSVPLWLVAAPLPWPLLAAGMLVSGLANPAVNAPTFTLVTLGVPSPLRAKAMLAFLTVTLAAGGAGLFLTGPAAELFGARQVILGAAALSTACAVGFALATRGAPPPDRRERVTSATPAIATGGLGGVADTPRGGIVAHAIT
jgi:hypothetical protein